MRYALTHGTFERERAVRIDGVNLCAIKCRHDANMRNFRYRTGKRPPIRTRLEQVNHIAVESTISRGKTARNHICRFNFLGNLERVKGIEPSYSAWKAAALPLSYTRVQTTPIMPGRRSQPLPQPSPALTVRPEPPILKAPSTTKGGDPVSYLKRCHLAGIAR